MRTIMKAAAAGAAAAILTFTLQTSAKAQSADDGWFVVVGSYSASRKLEDEATANTVRVVKAANRCGFRPTIARSNSYLGMRPGLTVQVIGGYRREVDARRVLAVVQRCVPDAFVKRTISLNVEDEE